jgi:tRNA-splicing ligase RtcB (3'-phosphate/5'-hydroxy nucleic acid ligase)
MDTRRFRRISDHEWWIDPAEGMRVPGIIYATEDLIRGMDDKVYDQVANVAKLPGIVGASYAMPDAHWGYGFPIGGVAAFDPAEGGVVSAGGVGFDISCGVRDVRTGLTMDDIEPVKTQLADELFRIVPAGVGSRGAIHLSDTEMDAMLEGGAEWAVQKGWGRKADLERIEEYGRMEGADPEAVSTQAKRRQRDEMGTLGSGNHYLEVQRVERVFDSELGRALGLEVDSVVVSIHCGSRGLGHQIGTEFLQRMAEAASSFGIELPDRELACAPIDSDLGREYLGAMRAGINCALANREIITHLAREAFATVIPKADLELIYDVSHNTCKLEEHAFAGRPRRLFVHRKGATRAFPRGRGELPEVLRGVGQPVLIGGTMGTASWVLMGANGGRGSAFASACHGAGRAMSRHQATKRWKGRQLVDELAAKGILIRCHSSRGVAEEAPGAYKDVDAVVDAAEKAGLVRRVARMTPVICVKG